MDADFEGKDRKGELCRFFTLHRASAHVSSCQIAFEDFPGLLSGIQKLLVEALVDADLVANRDETIARHFVSSARIEVVDCLPRTGTIGSPILSVVPGQVLARVPEQASSALRGPVLLLT
jgi:hypothetical protein